MYFTLESNLYLLHRSKDYSGLKIEITYNKSIDPRSHRINARAVKEYMGGLGKTIHDNLVKMGIDC